MVYADTSFLFSIALHDANTAAAFNYLKAHPTSLVFTPWQRCELRNAIHLAVWRGNCDAMLARRAIEKISSDVSAGNLIESQLDWPEVFMIAEKLSDRHTAALGVRTLDLLHVAAAVSLGAKNFITCDGRQHALANAVGLHGDRI
jgi:predicted nucleic acid-binding protein